PRGGAKNQDWNSTTLPDLKISRAMRLPFQMILTSSFSGRFSGSSSENLISCGLAKRITPTFADEFPCGLLAEPYTAWTMIRMRAAARACPTDSAEIITSGRPMSRQSPVPGAEVHMFFDTRPHAAGRPGPVGVFGAFRAGGAAVPRATRTSAPDGEHSFSRRRGRDANRLEELVRPGLAVRRIRQQVRQRQRTQPLAVRVRADSPRTGAGGAAEELCAREVRARAGGHVLRRLRESGTHLPPLRGGQRPHPGALPRAGRGAGAAGRAQDQRRRPHP